MPWNSWTTTSSAPSGSIPASTPWSSGTSTAPGPAPSAWTAQPDKSAPLFGVPTTVKESFDVQGLPTTRGHPELKDQQVTISSIAIRRLEAAGAVIFGKTNVPVDLADWQSYNPVYGTTSNPWNTDHTPGGSSGGSAAALAAGLTGFEIGSDIGGSIRVPAHFCGVFGHKPTWGLLPNYGDPVTSAAAGTDIAVIGPLSRSATDLITALDILAAPDPDETGLTLNLPAPRFSSLKDLRVAVWAEQPGQATDSETIAAMHALADNLERQGVAVSRSARPDFDPTAAYQLYLRLLDTGWSGRSTDAQIEEKRQRVATLSPDDMSADAIMARTVDMTHRAWLGMNEQRARWRRTWSAFFRDHDVLLCPSFSTAALPHRQDGTPWGTPDHRGRPGHQLRRPAVLARPDRRLPLARHRRPDGLDQGRAAAGRADRRPDLRRPHHPRRRGPAGASRTKLQTASGMVASGVVVSVKVPRRPAERIC